MEHVSTVSRTTLLSFVRAHIVLGWCFSQPPHPATFSLDRLNSVPAPSLFSRSTVLRSYWKLTFLQLCAVSTVGIAATGFALARREPHQQRWSHTFTHSKDITPGSTTRTDPTTSRPLDAPIYELRESKDSVAEPGPNWTLPHRRRERRRRQTYTNPPSNPSSDSTTQESAPASGRPSSSWLRRLSVISSSNSGSPLPSPSTVSSLNGSTATTHSRTDSAPKFPNKLVKRSTSQHSIRPPGDRGRRPMSATLGLRRPVTSHQRSSDIGRRTSFNKETGPPTSTGFFDNLWSNSGNTENVSGSKWRPYFSKANSRRKHSAGGAVVTINPRSSSDHRYFLEQPTLLLSSDIDVPKDTRLVSRKQSLSRPSNTTMNSPSTRHGETKKINSSGSIKREKRRPVRSSSFSEMPGDSSRSRSNSVRNNPKTPIVTTRQRAMERNISNPLPQPFDSMLADQSESPRLRRKRNFTWSDPFLRPQTAPQGKSSNSRLPNHHETSPRSHGYQNQPLTSPKRSLSNETTDLDSTPSPAYPSGRGSSPPVIRYSRVNRLSGTASDRASTVIGSDDTRIFTSADEDDQSDSVFDSFRTRISSTSNNSSRRGPNIETIFRDAPKKGNLADVDDLAFEGLHLSSCTPDSSVSDLNSTSTPLASAQMKDGDTTPTSRTKMSSNNTVSPSPLKSLDTHIYEVDADFETEYHENDKLTLPPTRPNILDFVEDDDFDSWDASPRFDGSQPTDLNTPSLRRTGSGIGIRASVFDWSEQTRNDRDTQDPDHRPSTVHGKQNTVGRGSRVTGRKAPNAVHLRSQSVPVSRDGPPSNESRQPSLKFGTWGLGQKGVSEDWDGDFDFGDADDHSADGDDMATGNRDPFVMKVPQAIMESQASVHGQYGHVQELTLLVEELKRLRVQGNMLHLIHGPSADLWKEAEGIINLATLEEDENGFLAPASPSSCGSFDEFESPPQKAMKRGDSEIRRPPLAVWPNPGTNSSPPNQKDPSSKVKSVLETIYQQREHTSHQTLEATTNSIQKLPFDTQSLKDLVNRAGMVTRSLKDVIRRAEGVTTSPESHTPSDPPFSRIFAQSP